MDFDKDFLGRLFEQAIESPRLRQSFDLRTSSSDSSQRILNALYPGTVVPIHRHLNTSETVVCLFVNIDDVIYEESDSNKEVPFLREVQRIRLCPTEARYGCQVPMGAWHTVEVIEPSVIFEAKDGAYAPLTIEDVWSYE